MVKVETLEKMTTMRMRTTKANSCMIKWTMMRRIKMVKEMIWKTPRVMMMIFMMKRMQRQTQL